MFPAKAGSEVGSTRALVEEQSGARVGGSVLQSLHAVLLRAGSAAKELFAGFETMTDDPAFTVRARRREGMNRALEAVKDVRASRSHDLEGLVVVVSAHFTDSHEVFLLLKEVA